MQSVYEGLTGTVRFNTEGFRSDFGLNIFELKEGGITDIGNWNYSSGVSLARMFPNQSLNAGDSLQNMSFTVIITLVRIVNDRTTTTKETILKQT